jgi:hypothetical protein
MKNILAFFLLFGLGTVSHAQFLKFGIKGGANLVKMEGVSFNDGYNLGYYGGGFVEMRLGEKWYIQPEVLFGETNLEYSEDFEDIYGNLLDANKLSSMKLQRLSIPITLNYKLANVFSLSGGVQFSKITDRGETFMNNAGKAFSEGDIGLIAGGNLMFGKFRVNARYIWGLKDMNNIDNQDAWKSQTAQLGLGFVF